MEVGRIAQNRMSFIAPLVVVLEESRALRIMHRWPLRFTVVPTAINTAMDVNLSNASLISISVTFANMIGNSKHEVVWHYVCHFSWDTFNRPADEKLETYPSKVSNF
ncbi:hypothetical protein ACS0TY_017319 [Phlomoides rotata]